MGKTLLLSFFAALVAAQDPPAPSVPAPSPHAPQLAIAGYSYGNFELLGSLCFLSDSQGLVTVSWDDQTSTISTTDSKGKIKSLDVNLLVYDEDGFDQLFDSRVSSYEQTKKECIRRKNLALDVFPLTKGANSKSIALSQIEVPGGEDARQTAQIFFVIEQCTSLIPVNIKSYKIFAAEAVNCDIIRKGENVDRSTASWVAIVILILTIILMLVPTIIFFIRSRQLASVEL